MQAKLVFRVAVGCLLLMWVDPLSFALAQAPAGDPVIGKVVAWGSNTLGQTNVPPNLTNIIAIAAGSVHSLALRNDGTVYAWGTSNIADETNVPPGLSNVVAIAAAGFYGNKYGYSLALKSDGKVTGWGAVSLPPDLSNVVAVAAGAYWWMALRSDGTVTSDYPYLTNGLLALGSDPLSNAVAVASGGRHCLALLRDGTVAGWGNNYDGQVTGAPSGSLLYTNGIVKVSGQILSNVVEIAAGNMHSVALKADGTVVAWGNNSYGQTSVPTGLSNVVAIASGGNESANQVLAVKTDGRLVAWGGNNAQTNVPVGLTNVVAASVGSAHSLILRGAAPLNTHVRFSAPVWNTNRFSFSLPTQSGRVYSLEYKSSLDDAGWTYISLTPGDGHLRSLTDSNATDVARFYRVQQW